MEYLGGTTIPDWAPSWVHGVHNPPLPMDRRTIADTLSSLDSLRGTAGMATADDRLGIAVLGAMADLDSSAPADLAVMGADTFAEGGFVVLTRGAPLHQLRSSRVSLNRCRFS